MAAKIVDKEAKRAEIIEAALEVFMDKGFEKASISNIAAKAGVGKGTVYEYFENKNQIIDLSFAFFMERMGMDQLHELVNLEIPAKEKLKTLIDNMAGIVLSEENSKIVNMMFNLWAESMRVKDVKSIIYEDMSKMYAHFRGTIAAIIDEGKEAGDFRPEIDSVGLAAVIIGALDGMMVQWVLAKEIVWYKGSVDAFLDIIMKGLEN